MSIRLGLDSKQNSQVKPKPGVRSMTRRDDRVVTGSERSIDGGRGVGLVFLYMRRDGFGLTSCFHPTSEPDFTREAFGLIGRHGAPVIQLEAGTYLGYHEGAPALRPTTAASLLLILQKGIIKSSFSDSNP